MMDDELPTLTPHERYQQVILDRQGQIRVFVTNQGLYLRDSEGKLIEDEGTFDFGSLPEVLLHEAAEELWVGTPAGLRRFETSGSPLDWSTTPSGSCERLAASPSGLVAAAFKTASRCRVMIFGQDGGHITESPFPGTVNALHWTASGSLIVSGFDCVKIFRLKKGRLIESLSWNSGISDLRCLVIDEGGDLISGHHGGALERRSLGRHDPPTRVETDADGIHDLALVGGLLVVWRSDGSIEIRRPTSLVRLGIVNEPRLERAGPTFFHRLTVTPDGGLILPIDGGRELLTLTAQDLDPWQLGTIPNLTESIRDPEGRWLFDPVKRTLEFSPGPRIELSPGETELIAVLARLHLQDPDLPVPEDRLQSLLTIRLRTIVQSARKKLKPFGVSIPTRSPGQPGYRLLAVEEFERVCRDRSRR